MCRKHVVLIGILVQIFSCIAFADRPLDRVEILQIFKNLTSQPKKAWIPIGTIEAIHQEYKAAQTTDIDQINGQIRQEIQEYQDEPDKPELTENLQKMRLDAIPFNVRYKLSNEYTMRSTVIVRFDGERFYWEIEVDSRADSVKLPPELEGNFMIRQFNPDWNARRIFAWDGQEYTMYSLSGNQALVDANDHLPHVVTGPLTAGLIPWGYGYYTYDRLAVATCSAVEKLVDGQTQIHLTLDISKDKQTVIVLDPQKDYAAMFCLVNDQGKLRTYKYYNDYHLVSGNWVPTTIYIEQQDPQTNRLLAYDLWEFTKVSGDIPTTGDFDVEYETNAVVEYFSYLTNKPLMYRYSQMADTDFLLAERLAYAANEGIQPQNCATAASKYVANCLGKDVAEQQLAHLVREPDQTTSLYAIKRFLESLGLSCRAVKTDIETLSSLQGCETILHIPGNNHFVVLAGIDSSSAWCVDLTDNKFFYRTDLNFFNMDWTDGIALLVSDGPIQIQGKYTEINDAQLTNIIGGDGYTCTRLLQNHNVIFCVEPVKGCCDGIYEQYYERYGCESAPSGSCSNSFMVRYVESPCIQDPCDPCNCTVTGEWTYYYMRACK